VRVIHVCQTFFLLEPTHWIMQVRQFANLKRYAERDWTRAARLAVLEGSPEGEERRSEQQKAS
jgi:hypothetical protein